MVPLLAPRLKSSKRREWNYLLPRPQPHPRDPPAAPPRDSVFTGWRFGRRNLQNHGPPLSHRPRFRLRCSCAIPSFQYFEYHPAWFQILLGALAAPPSGGMPPLLCCDKSGGDPAKTAVISDPVLPSAGPEPVRRAARIKLQSGERLAAAFLQAVTTHPSHFCPLLSCLTDYTASDLGQTLISSHLNIPGSRLLLNGFCTWLLALSVWMITPDGALWKKNTHTWAPVLACRSLAAWSRTNSAIPKPGFPLA